MQRLTISAMMFFAVLTLSACDKGAETNTATQTSASTLPPDDGVVDFAKLESLKGFTVGTGPSVMTQTNAYVLFDPQCPHCADLWRNTQPLSAQAKIKWIPVGFLNAKSKTQAGVLLESSNPAELMDKYETEMAASGASTALDGKPSSETLEQVERNTRVLKNSGAQSVPAMLYRNPKNAGSLSQVTGSAPTADIASMLGVNYTSK